MAYLFYCLALLAGGELLRTHLLGPSVDKDRAVVALDRGVVSDQPW